MAGEVNFKLPGLGNQNNTLTITGDITGSGSFITGIVLTLDTVNSNTGTFQGLTLNNKGLVTAATNQNYINSAQVPATDTFAYTFAGGL